MSQDSDPWSDLPVETFSQGEPLIREGEDGGRLLILVSGTVAVWKADREVARTAAPGAIFGEMSALLEIPATATVLAVTDVEARVAPDARAFIRDTPGVALLAARTLAQRLYHATAYLADIKAQFADREDHFGMMDEILDELLQQQRAAMKPPAPRDSDPRL